MHTRDEAFLRRPFGERITVRLSAGVLTVAVLVVCWEMITRLLQVRPSALPSPTRLLLEIWREAPQLAKHAWITASTSFEGLVLGTATAFLVAGLAGSSPNLRRIAEPLLALLALLPIIALVPLFVLWFGFGTLPAVALSWILCFLTLLPNLQAGFESLPQEVFDFLQSLRMPSGQVFWKVRMVACLPFLIRALKVAIPLALAAVAVAELIGADAGLGFLMQYASSRADSPQLFAALTVLCLIAFSGNLVLTFAEEIWIQWPCRPAGCRMDR